MIEALIEDYGYLAVLVGTFFEGETVLVLGGLAAQHGFLRLDGVMAVAFLGSFCGDQTWFLLGRRYGGRWLAARPSLAARVERVTRLLDRNATLFILGFRFVWGLRSVSPLAIALSRVPTARFFVLNLIAAAIWAVAVGLLGYLFGHAVELALGNLRQIEEWLLAAAALLGLSYLVGRFVWTRVRRRTASLPPAAGPPRA